MKSKQRACEMLKATHTDKHQNIPFKDVTSDLFEFEGKRILIMDNFSKFIEVDQLKDQCSRTINKKLRRLSFPDMESLLFFKQMGSPSIHRRNSNNSVRVTMYCTKHNGEAECRVQVDSLWSKAPAKQFARLDYIKTPPHKQTAEEETYFKLINVFLV